MEKGETDRRIFLLCPLTPHRRLFPKRIRRPADLSFTIALHAGALIIYVVRGRDDGRDVYDTIGNRERRYDRLLLRGNAKKKRSSPASSHASLLLLLPLPCSLSRERERANKELRTRAGAFLVRDGAAITRVLWKEEEKEEETRETLFFFLSIPRGKFSFEGGGETGSRRFSFGRIIRIWGERKGWVEGKESRRFIGLSRAVEGIILPDVARSWEVFRRIFARDRL